MAKECYGELRSAKKSYGGGGGGGGNEWKGRLKIAKEKSKSPGSVVYTIITN